MADRAEKCAEDSIWAKAKIFTDKHSPHSFANIEELMTAFGVELIRSHYPDDRELLEAAKEFIRVNDAPMSDNVASDLVLEERAIERLRTAIERRG